MSDLGRDLGHWIGRGIIETTEDLTDAFVDVPAAAPAGSASSDPSNKPAAPAPPKPSASWFGKASKHCSKCGKASTKVDRPSCKACGSSEWNFEGVSKDESNFLATAQANATSRAKMMNTMEGSDDKGDEVVSGELAEALSAMKQAFQAAASAPGAGRAYELRGVHLGAGTGVAARKTLEDILTGFLHWSQRPADREARRWNISKAMRRVAAFAAFSEKHVGKYLDLPVEASEKGFATMLKLGMKIPDWESKSGTVMWVMELSEVANMSDKDLEEIDDRVTLRFFWFVFLAALFDEKACKYGTMFIQVYRDVDFSKIMKFSSRFKGVEDEMKVLFYECAAFKMHSAVLVDPPWWANFLIAIARVFMSKEMSNKIVSTDIPGVIQYVGGKEYLPQRIGNREYVGRYFK